MFYAHRSTPGCVSATAAISPNNQDILKQFGGVDANSLYHLLNINNNNLQNQYIDDEPEVMQISSYHDDNSLNNISKDKADSFSILSLNCQCLTAKFDQISIKVQQLQSKGFEFDAIWLQETWLSDDSDTSLFQIQGYNLISQGKICSEHGGLAICISNIFNFKIIDMNIHSQIWDGLFIEISKFNANKVLIIGNVYRN